MQENGTLQELFIIRLRSSSSSSTNLDFDVDVAIVRVDDDHVKIPSLKLLLSFGNTQQSAVLPLLKVL